MKSKSLKVAVLGASAQVGKYSNQAVEMLKEYGHIAIPIHPSGREVAQLKTLRSLSEIEGPLDTLTLYVGPSTSSELSKEILAAKPRRIIMNPGAENNELKSSALAQGIEVVEGCTLVMLRTGQF